MWKSFATLYKKNGLILIAAAVLLLQFVFVGLTFPLSQVTS